MQSEIAIDETVQAAAHDNGGAKTRSKGGLKPFKPAKDKRGALKAIGDSLAKPAPVTKPGGKTQDQGTELSEVSRLLPHSWAGQSALLHL